jgi:hypothetical protein
MKRRWRIARATGFAVGGGVALTLLFAVPAMAQDVVVQPATVVNAGGAVANSGGNEAVGNDSANVAVNSQTANGFLGANSSSGGGNASKGSASITTGAATAVGNNSTTTVSQTAATGGAGAGPDVVVQPATVVNAGVAVANSGGNVATGNDSFNVAVNDQDATGVIASNAAGGGGNASDGTATIVTGSATAVGNQSATTITQAATTGDDALGIDVVVQPATVVNLGAAVANSGLNSATGNDSFNLAFNFQDANGLIASNVANGAGNASDGHASVLTGAATAVGNDSMTSIDTAATTGDDGLGLNVVYAPAFVLNAGFALANSGFNGPVVGNDAFGLVVNVQSAGGLIASNVANAVGNSSLGSASVATGAANAAGNKAITAVRQRLA